MCGHLLRFDPRCAMIHEGLGASGRLLHMYFRRRRSRAQAARYSRVHPAFVILSHDADLANWYAGVPFRRVLALEGRFSGMKVPDALHVLVEYENGVTAILEGGWLLPEGGCAENDVASVVTDREAWELSLPGGELLRFVKGGLEAPNTLYGGEVHGIPYGPLRSALDYMVSCLRQGRRPALATVEDGLRAVELLEAAVRAAREGRPVERRELAEPQAPQKALADAAPLAATIL